MSVTRVWTDSDELEAVRYWPEPVNVNMFTGYYSSWFVKHYAKIVKVSKDAKIRNRYNH